MITRKYKANGILRNEANCALDTPAHRQQSQSSRWKKKIINK